jgi:hypothetical protein
MIQCFFRPLQRARISLKIMPSAVKPSQMPLKVWEVRHDNFAGASGNGLPRDSFR